MVQYLKLILHRFSQYTSYTHLHNLYIYAITYSNTFYISVCFSLLINGSKSVNEQTQKRTNTLHSDLFQVVHSA